MSSTGSSVRVRARPARREPIAVFVLGSLFVIAPQLLGGVYPWGVLTTAAVAGLALLAAVWANKRRTELRGPLWAVFLLALAWTALQALPLPCGLVRLLAPDSVEQLERVYGLFERDAPSFCTISRDPGATRQEIVKGLALMCSFAGAALLVRLGQRRNVLRALAGAGTLLALIALGHAAVGATTVFGVYTPIEVRDQPFLAPVLNLNSLGGVLALCWPIALAMAISTRSTNERAFWMLSAAALATTVLMTRSRGAAGALALELLVFALLGLRVRERVRTRAFSQPHERLSLGLAVIAVIAVSVYSSYGEVLQEFQRGAWDKLELIAKAAAFAGDHFWLGIGRGAFGSVFASVHNSGTRRFEYPENFVVQWASEWGAPLCLALVLVVVLAMVRGARGAKSWERCGAVAGTLGLAAQNLVDLGFELLSVAVFAAAALACATVERDTHQATERPAFRSPLSALALATWVTALALGPALIREYPGAVSARVRAAMAHGSQQEVRTQLAVGMFAHPSEPSFALLGATDALRRSDPRAGVWINRALQLAPGWASPHTLAAAWLWNGGHHKQALLEIVAAWRVDFVDVIEFACRVTRVWPRGIASVAAKTEDPPRFLERLGWCDGLEDAQRAALDRAILHYDPKAPHARVRESMRARNAGKTQEALAMARDVLREHPTLPEAYVAEAYALIAQEQWEQARDAIGRGLHNNPRAGELRDLQLMILTKLRDRASLAQVFATLRGLAEDNHQLAMAYHREGDIEAGLGNLGAALRAYQQAYAVGEDPASLRALARTAHNMGDEGRARRVYAQLCAIAPEDVASCANARPTERPINGLPDERAGSAAQQFLK